MTVKKSPDKDGDSGARQVDDLLAKVPKAHRAALEKIRATVRAALPEAEEAISYGLPAFKYKGKSVAGYWGYKDHCSYFPMSGHVLTKMASELEGYETSKGAIHFQPEKPMPSSLIRKLLKARIAEIEK